MSLMIKGMDMPKNCESCKHKRFIGTDTNSGLEPKLQYECLFCNDVIITLNGEKNSSCKFEQLPTPHGRLIDADRLIAVLKSTTAISQSDYDLFNHIVGMIEHQPTVAEKEMNNESK